MTNFITLHMDDNFVLKLVEDIASHLRLSVCKNNSFLL